MTYRIVVVDDERVPAVPSDSSIRVDLYRTPAEALRVLQQVHAEGQRVEELWLDHDLGLDDDGLVDIWPVVNWLEEQAVVGSPLLVDYVFVHTANPVGADRMVAALRHYRVARAVLPTERG